MLLSFTQLLLGCSCPSHRLGSLGATSWLYSPFLVETVNMLSLSFAYLPLYPRVSGLRCNFRTFCTNVWADRWVINSSSVPWRLRAALKVIGRREECDCLFVISNGLLVVIYYLVSPLRKSLRLSQSGIQNARKKRVMKTESLLYTKSTGPRREHEHLF